MATSIRLIRRYVWLIETIRRGGQMTQEEVNESWRRNCTLNDTRENEIPERTFHRHRDGAYDVFGVRIGCDRRSGKYYIENPEILEGNAFSSVMFRSLALDNRLLDNRELSSRIIDEDMNGGEVWMSTVVEALDTKRKLNITYLSQFSGSETTAEIEPQFLKRHNRRWYLIARHPSGSIIAYALDRMVSAKVSENTFEFDPGVNPSDYYSDIIGVNLDTDYECERIVIRVKSPQRNYLDHLPLHHTQRCLAKTEAWSEYEFRLRAEYEFQHELMKIGENVEVLQPAWLRHQLYTYAKAITENCKPE